MANEKTPPDVSRRQFVGTVAATAAGLTIVPRHVLGAGFQAPSDTVNVAVVGYAHGMGTSNLRNAMKSDNIVALCDVDESEAAKAARVQQRDDAGQVPEASRGVQGLPRDAREAEGHRRGHRRHARSHARARGHGGDAARQARLRAEADDAHRSARPAS